MLENALRDVKELEYESLYGCLNPCFVGKCSTRHYDQRKIKRIDITVLILVLLENALRAFNLKTLLTLNKNSLNPCFVGKCSTSDFMA